MNKFGEIIAVNIPVLIDFYTDWSESSLSMNTVLDDVVLALGNKAKVVKVNLDNNITLANALRVTGVPTFMIYNKGEMVWRANGELDANTLISRIEECF